MTGDFDQILDDCIQRMNEDQGLEECLKLYPEFAQELKPLLTAVDELRDRGGFIPSQASKARGKERLSRAMAELERKRQESRARLSRRLFWRPKVWVPVAAALLAAIIGYSLWGVLTPTEAPVSYAGMLEIRVIDAPTHDVSTINVTVGDIEVHKAGEESDTDGAGWLTVIEGSKTFDLLKLRGVEEVLGSNEVDVGHYTQIRMDVIEVTVTVDGKPQSAVLPSGKLRLVGSFEVEREKTTVLTLDFDADKSIKITGAGKVIFEPVVKLIVTKVTEAPTP